MHGTTIRRRFSFMASNEITYLEYCGVHGDEDLGDRVQLLIASGVINSTDEKMPHIHRTIEAYSGNVLVGISGLYRRKGFIPMLFVSVHEKYRNKKIGQELVKKILNTVSYPVFLTVDPKNASAYYIYKKQGFKSLFFKKKIRGTPHELMVYL